MGDLHSVARQARVSRQMRVATTQRMALLWRAAGTSLALSVLFLIVYNACNYVTSLRTDVGTWFYEWERHIPFVPLFTIPYMSIDLFFVAAPFLCRAREEQRLYSRRTALAILLGGCFFLLIPLRLAVERPVVTGWLGAIFNPFCQIDKPHNLVPSLHIALRTILADLYGRHTRGFVRGLSHVWFSLVGFSTLLVHQHHVVDVIGGFLLAGFCRPWFSPTYSSMITFLPRRRSVL